MATAKKRCLSESTYGSGIGIDYVATAGNTIHIATASTVAGTVEEIWLWAVNNHTADVVLTTEFSNDDPAQNIIVTIPFKSGLIPIVPGFILQNGLTVKAFASDASVITIFGFVNTITD